MKYFLAGFASTLLKFAAQLEVSEPSMPPPEPMPPQPPTPPPADETKPPKMRPKPPHHPPTVFLGIVRALGYETCPRHAYRDPKTGQCVDERGRRVPDSCCKRAER